MSALDMFRWFVLAVPVLGVVYAIYLGLQTAKLNRETQATIDDTRRMQSEWLQLRSEREFERRLNQKLHIATRRKS